MSKARLPNTARLRCPERIGLFVIRTSFVIRISTFVIGLAPCSRHAGRTRRARGIDLEGVTAKRLPGAMEAVVFKLFAGEHLEHPRRRVANFLCNADIPVGKDGGILASRSCRALKPGVSKGSLLDGRGTGVTRAFACGILVFFR